MAWINVPIKGNFYLALNKLQMSCACRHSPLQEREPAHCGPADPTRSTASGSRPCVCVCVLTFVALSKQRKLVWEKPAGPFQAVHSTHSHTVSWSVTPPTLPALYLCVLSQRNAAGKVPSPAGIFHRDQTFKFSDIQYKHVRFTIIEEKILQSLTELTQ